MEYCPPAIGVESCHLQGCLLALTVNLSHPSRDSQIDTCPPKEIYRGSLSLGPPLRLCIHPFNFLIAPRNLVASLPSPVLSCLPELPSCQ